MSLREIQNEFGSDGITFYRPAYGLLGAITDDTQMTLFTAEGMLRAFHRERSKGMSSSRSVVRYAYLRWLATQGDENKPFDADPPSWLFNDRRLHAARAPGNTCLSALRAHVVGNDAQNDSKGCGGVMRVAPCGLLMSALKKKDLQSAFEFGAECARITHHHATGYLSAGAFSALVYSLALGHSMEEACQQVKQELAAHPDHAETFNAMASAERLALSGQPPTPDVIAQLGEGWIAEEALGMAVYAAWVSPSVEYGIRLAVNHGGDSDSTGAMAGNLLGALYGEAGIEERWLIPLELRDVISQVADDLFHAGLPEYSPDWGNNNPAAREFWGRYPPC